MSNIANGILNLGLHSAGKFLRAGWIAAGPVPVKNRLGERQALVVGLPDRFWNRPLEGGRLTPPLNMDVIEKDVASFTPRTTREVLEMTVKYLKEWGFHPVAEYYFGMENGQYHHVVNTNLARSLILSVAFDGETIAKVDRNIVAGKITGPINDIIHPFGVIKYGINTLLIKLSAYLGYPKSFIILPVKDGNRVTGKVNLGLRDTRLLSPEQLTVLQLLADKIKGTSHENEVDQASMDRKQVESFIDFVDDIYIWKFLLWSPEVAEGARMLAGLLSSSMETTLGEKAQKERAYREAMITLVNMIEAKEHSTGGHSVRVAKMSQAIAQRLPNEVWEAEMRRCGVKEADWARTIKKEKELIYYHALIHDIGKNGIPDAVLNNPGRHTPEERAIMQTHVEIGRRRIMRTEERFDDNPFFNQSALDVVGGHHMAYNGREGYPDSEGKQETQLPLAARIVYGADCYDAMVSKRCYQDRKEPDETTNELVKGLGTFFDPAVVRTMLELFSVRHEENDADSYFMIEEILQVLGTETNPELRYLPEKLMSKLRGSSKVADLEPFLTKMRQETGILEESEKWFGEMDRRVQEKKSKLIAQAALGLRFYDSVAIKTVKTCSDYINCGHYSPRAVREFMSELYQAWQKTPDQKFIVLVSEAFKNAGEKAADFKSFFFEPNTGESTPTPTPALVQQTNIL